MSASAAGERVDDPPAPTEEQVLEVGQSVAAALPRAGPMQALDRLLMRALADDDRLRAALFRFVDVRPACRTRRDVGDHLVALLEASEPASWPGRTATRLARRRRTRGLVAALAGLGVQRLAHQFILGRSVEQALPALDSLWQSGVAVSVDLLGEATVSEAEADGYASRCADALTKLHGAAASWPRQDLLERDAQGLIPRANLSVKITALTPQIRADAPERGSRGAVDRLRGLMRLARDLGAHLHVDMESLDSRDTVLGLTLELLGEPEFRSGPSAGVVVQAYLSDSPEELDRILDWRRSCLRPAPLTVRLVKGAYWDHEVVEARQHGWEVPVFQSRAECDRNFEQLTRRLLSARPSVRVALASHNLRSIAHGLACLPLYDVDPRDLELQVLRGLGDDLQAALVHMGLRVRTYCPVGDLVEGMAYLVRRMLENTANDSFLAARARGVSPAELLAPP